MRDGKGAATLYEHGEEIALRIGKLLLRKRLELRVHPLATHVGRIGDDDMVLLRQVISFGKNGQHLLMDRVKIKPTINPYIVNDPQSRVRISDFGTYQRPQVLRVIELAERVKDRQREEIIAHGLAILIQFARIKTDIPQTTDPRQNLLGEETPVLGPRLHHQGKG